MKYSLGISDFLAEISSLSHSVVFLYFFALITEELYKKDLHDQENHDGVITHLEPDILECEVKSALEQSWWT